MERKKKIIIIFNALALIFWCGLIFYMSSKTAVESSQQSTSVASVMVKFFYGITGSGLPENVLMERIDGLEDVLRSFAHGFVYFVLSLLMINLLNLLNTKKLKLPHIYFISITSTMIYALSDEIHQLFVDGRSFQLIDLALDFTGAVIALILYYLLINKRYEKINGKRKNRNVQ